MRCVGMSSHAALAMEVVRVFGRLVSFGNAGGAEPWRAGQDELYAQGRSVGGFSALALAQSAPDALRALTERALRTVCDGAVVLPVTAEFPLSDAASAHQLIGGRTSVIFDESRSDLGSGALPAECPRDVPSPHDPGHLFADLTLEYRPPRHEREFSRVLDHRHAHHSNLH